MTDLLPRARVGVPVHHEHQHRQHPGGPVTTTDITYCANGCKQGGKNRVQTTPPSKICARCEDRIHSWLTKIPDAYALLPTFIEHGSTDPNPGSKTTKRAEVAAPMRLEIIDLLDTRFGRKWLGTAAANDRRGVAGALKVHVERLQEERPLTTDHDHRSVSAACALLDRHRLWIAEQDWVTYLYDDLHDLHRALSDAIGNYRRPPVGRCHLVLDNDDTCAGKLYANAYGGVRCARCAATWDAGELRLLGLALAQQEGA